MLVMRLSVVSHNLHPSNHLAYREETQYLSDDDPNGGKLIAVDVANGAQDSLGVHGVCGGARA